MESGVFAGGGRGCVQTQVVGSWSSLLFAWRADTLKESAGEGGRRGLPEPSNVCRFALGAVCEGMGAALRHCLYNIQSLALEMAHWFLLSLTRVVNVHLLVSLN
jgi:hypothetical protein